MDPPPAGQPAGNQTRSPATRHPVLLPAENNLPRLPVDDPLYEEAQAANRFIQAAKAPATLRAYASDWRHFAAWCREKGVPSLPASPDTVALYLSGLAEPGEGKPPRKASTITRRLTAISAVHKRAGHLSPASLQYAQVAETLQGIRRTLGTAPTMKKPLTLNRIVKVLHTLEGPIAAARDKALLLLGFAGGMRRSELAALRVEHLSAHRKGYTLRIPRSKTDPEGKGREVEIPLGAHDQTCPVLALENWLKVAGIQDGFVLRRVSLYGTVGEALDKDSIGRIVKRLVKRARLGNPDAYGGHSLRAGFVTEASGNGATDRQIMRQTGHKSRAMIDRYSREEQKDRQAAVSRLGL